MAAGFVLLVGLLLGGCTARGGGQIGAPLPDSVPATFSDAANFGFTLTCGIENNKAVVRGQLQYHDHGASEIDRGDIGLGLLEFGEVKIHGELDPMITSAATCDEVERTMGSSGSALFQGRYRPDDLALPVIGEGRFTVQLFDQGEPARPGGDFTGDGFAIELFGGNFSGYTRGGYLTAGNVQVEQ